MVTIRQSCLFFGIAVLFAACSTTKSLPADEKLYTGATVKLETANTTARQKKVLKSDLQGLTRPRPNGGLFGLPIKLYIYNMFAKAKPNSFFGKLRDRYGQPPVLLSSVDLENNVKLLENHLENKGFFKAGVSGDTVSKGKKGHAEYTADAGSQYKINSIAFPDDSSALSRAIRESTTATLLKKGDPYDLDVIRGERNRIDVFLKERGFFYFNPDHLLMQVDSTVGNNQVDMRVIIKPEVPAAARQVYTINNVYIYSGYNVNNAADTSKQYAKVYDGYHIVDRRNRFKPKLFTQVMKFQPGDVYNRTDHNLTLSRLINLNEFRFVRNRFEPLEDSAQLNAYYYLTPLQKKSIRAETNTTTKSNNMNGLELTVNWRNRNTFRAGEQLNISAYIGSEVQFGGPWKGYNTYRSGVEANFAIPRFVVPFFNVPTRGGYVPRTNIQLGYDVLNRRKLYTLNSYRGGLGYIWKESVIKQHEFYPISINYVQPLNVTQTFKDSIGEHPYLARIIDSQFIIGTTYQYNLNQVASGIVRTNAFYFNGLIDLSGNILGMLTGADVKAGKQVRIMNAAFNQYIKLEADFRYYRRLGTKSSWANRVIVGLGRPYGNSLQLPYVKQFFVGGNNSIRAFRSRTVGPGTFPLLDKGGFFPDQTGDMKLELNTEFRPHISGPLYGAVFIDAGNIWLANEDPSRPGAKFTTQFLNELAIGTGAGVRIDIQLFVIRFDLGIPIKKPWEENPWYIRQLNLGQRAWRRENIMFNLAIGYPF